MISRTPELHNALRIVKRHEIDWFPGYIGGHPVGYAWHQGGELPQSIQDALAMCAAADLIGYIAACIHREPASEVVLTRKGDDALSLWEQMFQGAQISPARGNGLPEFWSAIPVGVVLQAQLSNGSAAVSVIENDGDSVVFTASGFREFCLAGLAAADRAEQLAAEQTEAVADV